MRFACQSCGKAYNLPEEKIVDKSNVRLKCRVCGAIVEVKKQGELVALVLDEGEGKRPRVSEAPAPLSSISPDEDADDGATVSISESSLNGTGPLQHELLSGPGALALDGSPPALPVPGLSLSSPQPPPLLRAEAAALERLGGASPPPLAMGLSGVAAASSGAGLSASPPPLEPLPPPLDSSVPPPLNGSGDVGFHHEPGQLDGTGEPAEELIPPVAPRALTLDVAGGAPLGNGSADFSLPPAAPALPPLVRDDTMKKMIAAFLTGVLIDRLISGLFF